VVGHLPTAPGDDADALFAMPADALRLRRRDRRPM
jgi:hypothetical protein